MKKLVVVWSLIFSFFSATAAFATVNAKADKGFPGRAEFPEVSVYTKSDLAKHKEAYEFWYWGVHLDK